ncbi:MAG: phosphatase PAP2 family protein [Thermodesulfovibrionales bacterium]
MTGPSDKVTIFFSLFLLLLVIFNYSNIPVSNYLIIIYISIIFFQFVLIKLSRHNDGFTGASRACRTDSILKLSRDIVFPVVSVLVIFDSLEGIVHNINPRDIDYILIRLDYFIFNAYPGLMIEKIENPFLTEIVQVAYTSYYFLPITLGILLKVKGDREGFNRTLFLILLCFYLSYVGYLLFPALGPRYTMNHLYSGELKGLFFFEHIQRILNQLEGIKRDAFPSGHTAIALTVLVLAYRYHRRFFYVTLPVVLLLIFSTVYCRYHYVVDVIGGILLTVITFFVGNGIYKRYEPEKAKDPYN